LGVNWASFGGCDAEERGFNLSGYLVFLSDPRMKIRQTRTALLCVLSLLVLGSVVKAQSDDPIEPDETATAILPSPTAIYPRSFSPAAISPVSISPVYSPQTPGVQWGSVFKQAFGFLMIEEGFRVATEEGARHTHMPFFKGYAESWANLHGWADGDPFLVNYVGHPMQGSVSGFIWIQNDLKYRDVEIGKNRDYWKGRLRAAAFAFAYSEAEELGPLSEASVGATQAFFPQQGFADHVVTPTIGLAWIIAEDTVDKYVIKAIERHVSNPYVKLLVRGGLNPSRSLANVLGGNVPWNRYTRPGVFERRGKLSEYGSPAAAGRVADAEASFPKVAIFEFVAKASAEQDFGASGPCVGGGGEAAYRFRTDLQLVFQLGGCKMTGLTQNVSGDSLRFMVGPRWTPFAANRWSPFAELLAGGRKVSQETMFPEKKAALEAALQPGQTLQDPDHWLYASNEEQAGFAIKAGIGVDMKVNNALALRVASIDYSRDWAAAPLSGAHRSQGLQVASGLVLKMGTW
jgi:hypothetical protein